jgi:1-acyl-sn-glycerol-3-phosphate acyltransferase
VLEPIVSNAVIGFARLVTGVRGNWKGCAPEAKPRIYFANHNSHGDFVLIWTVMPAALRRMTRPVAAADYWLHSPLRRYLGTRVFRSVHIARGTHSREEDQLQPLTQALDEGASLILFPEGTRNTTSAKLLPFKSGLYRLAKARPEIEMVPVWIENLNRVMPKGHFVPIPLLCTVTFGAPISRDPGEPNLAFRERSRAALLALAPTNGHGS